MNEGGRGREGGRERVRERGRDALSEGGREGGRNRGRKGGWEGGREGGSEVKREGGKNRMKRDRERWESDDVQSTYTKRAHLPPLYIVQQETHTPYM